MTDLHARRTMLKDALDGLRDCPTDIADITGSFLAQNYDSDTRAVLADEIASVALPDDGRDYGCIFHCPAPKERSSIVPLVIGALMVMLAIGGGYVFARYINGAAQTYQGEYRNG